MSDFPPSYITGMTRHLRSAVVATESPFSLVQQVQDYGGERWEFDLDVIAEGRGFEAFSNQILGKRLPFTLTVPQARSDATQAASGGAAPTLSVGERGGYAGGTILSTHNGYWYVNGVATGHEGTSYTVRVEDEGKPIYQISTGSVVVGAGGAAAGASSIPVIVQWGGAALKAGDFISFEQNGRHRLHQLTQDVAPVNGSAVLHVQPRLRGPISAGLWVETRKPRVSLRAINQAPATVEYVVQRFTLSAVEVL